MTEKRVVIHTIIEIQEREDIEDGWDSYEVLIESWDRSGVCTEFSESEKFRLRVNAQMIVDQIEILAPKLTENLEE